MNLKKIANALAFTCAMGLTGSAAHATAIIDTGIPSNAAGQGWAFNSSHSYAGQFSLLSAMTVDSIQGYFNADAGSVGVSLYSNAEDGDGGFIPGSALRSTSFTTTLGALAWNGVSTLGWALDQGTYWVVFTASYSTASQSSMPGTAAHPLDAYALQQGGQWYDAADLELGQGLRVNATAAASVPEPGTMALLGLGLCGITLLGRRKQA